MVFMRLSHILAIALVAIVPVSCGQSGPQLTKTASGTWMSPVVQGEKQVVLSSTVVGKGDSVMNVTVLDVTTNFLPKGELLMRPDESKSQIIRLGLKVSNNGTKDLSYRYDAFALSMKNGTQGRISFYINQGNAQDFLQSATLKPGESSEGAVYYELPASVVRNDLVLEYRGADQTIALPLIR